MELEFRHFLFFVVLLSTHVSCTNITDIKTVDVSCVIYQSFNQRFRCYLLNTTDITEPTHFNIINIDEWKDATILYLESRNLDILPFGLCQQLPKLQEFEGVNTKFKFIQKENFIGGTKLKKINFWLNKIEKLPTNLFEYANNLEDIRFESNRISEIEPYAFNGTDNLAQLHMAYNLLTKIQKNTFTGAQNMKLLDLAGNKIETIEDGALNFPKLFRLDLSKNRLQVLSDNLFISASATELIDLAKNNISLVNHSLDNLSKLVSLDLSENKVTDLDIRALARKVWSLTLSDIGLKLEDLGSPAMNDSYYVRNLDISKNSLSRPDIFQYLKNFVHVELLNLEHNNITVIEQVEKIPDILPELGTIKIGGNNLGAHEKKTFEEVTIIRVEMD